MTDATALTTTTTTPAGAAALVPRTMPEAIELARVMASAGFLARELQTVGGSLFIIEQAQRWNMSPFGVAMETSFISGRPFFSGKVVAAAIVSSGTAGRLSYDYAGAGDDRTVTVSAVLAGEREPRSVRVRLGDVRTTNKVWISQPDQQLAYSGARVWARRHAPEVMLGVQSPEDFDEPPRDPMPPARGPTIDRAEADAGPGWPRVAFPIHDRGGAVRDMGDERAWVAELLRRVEVIQRAETMSPGAKRRAVDAVLAANRYAIEHVREAGFGDEAEEVEAVFRAALGVEQPGDVGDQ